jgi:uncharacterized membrane protein
MSPYLLDWLSLLGRWLHLTAGIAWIGSSFYFIWLDNHLLAPADRRLEEQGIAGELWAVHGGGFYHSRKFRLAPPSLPATLHWFYWEAYTTFLSGFFLLALLYYAQAQTYLIDPAVAVLSRPEAIAIGCAFLLGGWLVYDGLCRSPLVRHGAALGVVLSLLLATAAWGLCHLFSGRGAFVEFGAMLGTIMVANVLFVIIPGQRELVRAKRAAREPDARHGIAGKVRSTHNTYFTMPVLFTMISNHYAIVFGATNNWLALIGISAAGVGLRQYFVARHKAHERSGHTSPLPVLGAALALAFVAWSVTPNRRPGIGAALTSAQSFPRIEAIVARRCRSCHSPAPTQPGFAAAPNGVLLDTPAHILARTTQMDQQLTTRAMPAGNLTGLTEDERSDLLDWLHAGAPH